MAGLIVSAGVKHSCTERSGAGSHEFDFVNPSNLIWEIPCFLTVSPISGGY